MTRTFNPMSAADRAAGPPAGPPTRRRRRLAAPPFDPFGQDARDERAARELAADLEALVRAGLIEPVDDGDRRGEDSLRFQLTDDRLGGEN
jgi:hypothetical protein